MLELQLEQGSGSGTSFPNSSARCAWYGTRTSVFSSDMRCSIFRNCTSLGRLESFFALKIFGIESNDLDLRQPHLTAAATSNAEAWLGIICVHARIAHTRIMCVGNFGAPAPTSTAQTPLGGSWLCRQSSTLHTVHRGKARGSKLRCQRDCVVAVGGGTFLCSVYFCSKRAGSCREGRCASSGRGWRWAR